MREPCYIWEIIYERSYMRDYIWEMFKPLLRAPSLWERERDYPLNTAGPPVWRGWGPTLVPAGTREREGVGEREGEREREGEGERERGGRGRGREGGVSAAANSLFVSFSPPCLQFRHVARRDLAWTRSCHRCVHVCDYNQSLCLLLM